MPTALFFRPSYERLHDRIHAAAPDLRIALYEEDGSCTLDGKTLPVQEVAPEYFWIHSELFFSPRLDDYFQLMLDCPSTRWLHTINTGLDRPPYLQLLRKGVMITNNHSQAIPIAEYVMGQVLYRYQHIEKLRAMQQQREWRHQRFREVHGGRWLIIGFGHIGKDVARRAKAFGARVTAVRRRRDTEGLADDVTTLQDMKPALAQADVVVLTCASNEDTRNMVDARFLDDMKEGSTLVNIARGDLVVEADLRRALDRGRPDYAILDVFNQEPPAADSWVWEHPRVSLTPHCSNGGSGMRARSDQLFLDNLARQVQGEPLLNQVGERDIL